MSQQVRQGTGAENHGWFAPSKVAELTESADSFEILDVTQCCSDDNGTVDSDEVKSVQASQENAVVRIDTLTPEVAANVVKWFELTDAMESQRNSAFCAYKDSVAKEHSAAARSLEERKGTLAAEISESTLTNTNIKEDGFWRDAFEHHENMKRLLEEWRTTDLTRFLVEKAAQ